MIAAKMPSNAHYFFLNLLCIVRLNFEVFNNSVDDLASKLEEYHMISSDSSFYSAQLHNLGYRYNFLHNTLVIVSVALVLILVWLFVVIFERLRRICNPKSTKSAEISMSNFLVRFLLEAHFELMICAFISLTSSS